MEFRRRPGNDPMAPGANIQGNSKSTIQSLKDSLSKRFFGGDNNSDDGFIDKASTGSTPNKESIKLSPDVKGKSIDLTNLSQTEIKRVNRNRT
jgi:hypothetical protein